MSIWDTNLLSIEEVESFCEDGIFNVSEIEYLYQRFKYLDRSKCGFLSFPDLEMIPEFYANPLSKLILNSLESTFEYQKISFACFVDFLKIFNKKNEKNNRIDFLFSLFDFDKERKLTKSVFVKINNLITKGKIDIEDEIEYILDVYDIGKKGYLDWDDFVKFYNDDPSLENNLTISFTKNAKNKAQTLWEIFWPRKSKNGDFNKSL